MTKMPRKSDDVAACGHEIYPPALFPFGKTFFYLYCLHYLRTGRLSWILPRARANVLESLPC